MAPPSFEELMSIEVVPPSVSDGLNIVGSLIDLSFAHSDLSQRERGTEKALEWCAVIEKQNITDVQRVELDYFRANAWANRAGKAQDENLSRKFNNEPLQKQIYYLRRAVNNPMFRDAETLHKCGILTNLANALNEVGRFVEAHEHWNRALTIEPRFWMALGNRGYGRIAYAKAIYSEHSRQELIWAAFRDLSRAVELVPEFPYGSPGALEFFKWHIDDLLKRFGQEFLNHEMQFLEYSLGRSNREKEYRRWALRETLFLNTLNDLGDFSSAASDSLHLPDYVTPLEEPPILIGFFNQIKQEYVSARWLFFEAISCKDPHFSDREVYLVNTLDYPIYGLAVEKLKLVFRSVYSIFDKIAYFLNAYMKLGIPEREVNIRSIWIGGDKKVKRIRKEFEESGNWPLRGLYFLSKDLFEREFDEISDPRAIGINEDRNHIEHKYYKLHDDVLFDIASGEGMFHDNLARSSTRGDFEDKTLRLLKLARCALIYLACGMSARELELHKEKGRDSLRFTTTLPVINYKDYRY